MFSPVSVCVFVHRGGYHPSWEGGGVGYHPSREGGGGTILPSQVGVPSLAGGYLPWPGEGVPKVPPPPAGTRVGKPPGWDNSR